MLKVFVQGLIDVTCPNCKFEFAINPEAENETVVACPNCGKEYRLPAYNGRNCCATIFKTMNKGTSE